MVLVSVSGISGTLRYVLLSINQRARKYLKHSTHTCNTHDRHTENEHTGRPCYISWLLQKTVVNAINLPKKTEVVSKKPKLEEKIY